MFELVSYFSKTRVRNLRECQQQLLLALVLLLGVYACQSFAMSDSGPNQQFVGDNLWLGVSEHFQTQQLPEFTASLDRPAIQKQISWLKRNSNYLYNVTRRSEPYAHFIVTKCLERGLPVELALLPIVESAYDAYAYSPGRAAGLWQFVPSTGKYFGLEQNWWYDGRRDPVASTEAALDYLESLHSRFDNWLLAMAAYNAGPARVSRAIKKNKRQGEATDYWSLQLPSETRQYVPRLLAVREALVNAQQYGMRVFPVENTPYFRKVFVDSQLDLAQAAKIAGVEMEELYRLNPGLSRWATPPSGPYSLLVPFEKAQQFISGLAETPVQDRLRWERYTVKSGDSLSVIAHRFETDMSSIKKANDLDSSAIRIGQNLLIPKASEASAHYVLSDNQRAQARGKHRSGKAKLMHTVRPGESWWSIGKQHGISSATLARWNGKAPRDTIRPGQTLIIWKKLSDKQLAGIYRNVIYKVKNGDSLSRIASRYKVSVSQLLSWNDLSAKRYLQPGQALKIKVAVAGGV